ncbi:ArsR family transcriptional regulator, partial [bacterium]|nr:ArsR family transcriptional regulator [bacterium]
LNLLADEPACVEELASALDLAPSTVSHHLKTLTRAGMVEARRVQYYVEYELRPEWLSQTLGERLVAADGDRPRVLERVRQAQVDAVLSCFRAGRLARLPAAFRKQEAVLAALAADLEPRREYARDELRSLLTARVDDPDVVIDRWLEREWLEPAAAVAADRLRARPPLGAIALPPPPTVGVYWVKNHRRDRALLGSSLDAWGDLHEHQDALYEGRHPCAELQADWQGQGPEAFEFALLESIEPPADGIAGLLGRLGRLEAAWIHGLQPFGEYCYNETTDIRDPLGLAGR